MITRLFRVRVPRSLHLEFEQKFRSVSVPYVQKFPGLLAISIGKPMSETSEEYVMISQWESLEALKNFAGENWQQAVIPQGMEKYVQQCWIDHYQVFGHES